MSYRIEASNDSLMDQASGTADVYLDAAIQSVEARFGAGAAEKVPEIVAAHMRAAAIDYGASIVARAIEAVADRE